MTDGKLTVYFDDPFWVGVFERYDENGLSVCKTTFGAEPTDAQLYEFVLQNSADLRFSPSVETIFRQAADNPKRRIKNARKAMVNTGIGTKSQQALKLQRDFLNAERTAENRQRKNEREREKFELKQEKKKQKHKGR